MREDSEQEIKTHSGRCHSDIRRGGGRPTADDVLMNIRRGGGEKAINACSRFDCRSVVRVFEAWTLVRYGLVRGSRNKAGEDIH